MTNYINLRLFIFHLFSAFYSILNQDATRVRNKIDNLLKNYVCSMSDQSFTIVTILFDPNEAKIYKNKAKE